MARKKKSPRADEYKARVRTATYHSWNGMIQRCTNRKHRSYPQYGKLGVKVDPRWRLYSNFLSDMGERPAGMTLDRIDPTGNYTKANCRWATKELQNQNVRSRYEAQPEEIAGEEVPF